MIEFRVDWKRPVSPIEHLHRRTIINGRRLTITIRFHLSVGISRWQYNLTDTRLYYIHFTIRKIVYSKTNVKLTSVYLSIMRPVFYGSSRACITGFTIRVEAGNNLSFTFIIGQINRYIFFLSSIEYPLNEICLWDNEDCVRETRKISNIHVIVIRHLIRHVIRHVMRHVIIEHN